MLKHFILQTRKNEKRYEGYFDTMAECLEKAMSSGINLKDLKLSGYNLSHANLDGVDFTGSDFSKSNLMGANLSEAILNNCIFSNAKMVDVCLYGSQIIGSMFHQTNFSLADISDCTLQECLFSCPTCFSLSFFDTSTFKSCYFHLDGINYMMDKPPIVVKGLPRPMVIIGDHIMIGTTIKSFNEWNTHAQVALNSRAQDYFKDLQSDQITALDTNISFFQNYKKTIQSFCKKSYRNRCDMINKTSLCHESDVDLDSIFH